MVGIYVGTLNNFPLNLSKVYYAENIKNNLIQTHHLVLNGHTLIIDFDNIENRNHLQIFINKN